MKPLTLLISVHTAQPYGAARCAVELATAMSEAGFQAHFILPEPGPLEEILAERGLSYSVFPILHFGLRKNWYRPLAILDLLRALGSRVRFVLNVCSAVRRLRPAVAHVHSVFSGYAALAAKLAGAPLVWYVHEAAQPSILYGRRAWLLRICANKVVFASRAVADQYLVPTNKTHVVYYYVDHSRCSPPASSPRNHAPPLQICFVGQLIPRKGVLEFVDICRRLSARKVPFQATLYGHGTPDMTALVQEAISAANLEPHVRLAGFEPDMAARYRDSDVLLLTSRHEALPRVIMEAMWCGLPVVASRAEGTSEMVDDNVTGFLFDLESPNRAVEALVQLAHDPDARERMGQAAHARAEKLFCKERYVQELIAIQDAL